MDLIDRLHDLASQIPKQMHHITTEEATKNALVMPFINALGYNVFNPQEVTPELTADVGTKKGEKVDYAILKDGKPIMLFEVKACGTDLNKAHFSQLYRYFSVTEARFAILTNGIIYQFYSDLDAPNKMDETPFLVIDLLNLDLRLINEELSRFTKSAFDLEDTLSTANELKERLRAQRFYSGLRGQPLVEEFTAITKQAVKSSLRRQLEKGVKLALDKGASYISRKVRK